jgi:hypothetical protein
MLPFWLRSIHRKQALYKQWFLKHYVKYLVDSYIDPKQCHSSEIVYPFELLIDPLVTVMHFITTEHISCHVNLAAAWSGSLNTRVRPGTGPNLLLAALHISKLKVIWHSERMLVLCDTLHAQLRIEGRVLLLVAEHPCKKQGPNVSSSPSFGAGKFLFACLSTLAVLDV